MATELHQALETGKAEHDAGPWLLYTKDKPRTKDYAKKEGNPTCQPVTQGSELVVGVETGRAQLGSQARAPQGAEGEAGRTSVPLTDNARSSRNTALSAKSRKRTRGPCTSTPS